MEEADKYWMIKMVGGWVSVSSGTGSPKYSRTKGRKTIVVCVCVCETIYSMIVLLRFCVFSFVLSSCVTVHFSMPFN